MFRTVGVRVVEVVGVSCCEGVDVSVAWDADAVAADRDCDRTDILLVVVDGGSIVGVDSNDVVAV